MPYRPGLTYQRQYKGLQKNSNSLNNCQNKAKVSSRTNARSCLNSKYHRPRSRLWHKSWLVSSWATLLEYGYNMPKWGKAAIQMTVISPQEQQCPTGQEQARRDKQVRNLALTHCYSYMGDPGGVAIFVHIATNQTGRRPALLPHTELDSQHLGPTTTHSSGVPMEYIYTTTGPITTSTVGYYME